ncbi:LOW QUALITY PROTEIN: hypothetical protein MXB_4305, partial [Myxobolus squamalis]
ECRNFKQLRRLDIKDAQNFITQRLFQYSLLIESILKYSKEGEKDYDKIHKALEGCKQVTKNVNKAVENSENQKVSSKLIFNQIISKVDQKSEFEHEKEGLIDVLTNNQFIQKTSAHVQLKSKIYDPKSFFIIQIQMHFGNYCLIKRKNAIGINIINKTIKSWFKFLHEKQQTTKKTDSNTSIDNKEKLENKTEELERMNKNKIPTKSGMEKTISILKEILSFFINILPISEIEST